MGLAHGPRSTGSYITCVLCDIFLHTRTGLCGDYARIGPNLPDYPTPRPASFVIPRDHQRAI